MGGMGSGRRWRCGVKDTTEGSQPLDIRKLHRAGVLTPGRSFGWQWTINDDPVANIRVRVKDEYVELVYRHRCRGDNEWQDVEQPVCFDRTHCTYGGTRLWWICPSCGRRVAILYGAGRLFACRNCYRLAYESQREDGGDRALRRAQRIRMRLGGTANMMMPFPWKPKGMRWRIYERLRAVAEAATNRSLIALAARFNLPGRGRG
jgi:hypothetical protein